MHARLQYSSAILVPSLQNQLDFWVPFLIRMRGVTWVCLVLTNWGPTKAHSPNLADMCTKHKLLGKTANKWNTSPSASYPAALCEFLANLVLYAGASYGGGSRTRPRIRPRILEEVPLHQFLWEEVPLQHNHVRVALHWRLPLMGRRSAQLEWEVGKFLDPFLYRCCGLN